MDNFLHNYYNKGKELMKTQTHIATTIDSISPEQLRIDQSIKELLADVQILARILKYTVSELQTASIDEIIACIDESQIEIGNTSIEPGLTNYGKVHALSGEDTIQNEGTIYFDIRFPIYYGKDSIKKVYSIWICTNAGAQNDSINELCFVQRNIFGKEQSFTHIDKMQGVIITLRSGVGIAESRHKLIAMLEDLLSDMNASQKKELLEVKHDIKMTTTLEGRISNMCNLSEYMLGNAIEKGMAQEMTRGIAGLIKSLQKLGKDRDYILNEIMENYSLSEEEAQKYL